MRATISLAGTSFVAKWAIAMVCASSLIGCAGDEVLIDDLDGATGGISDSSPPPPPPPPPPATATLQVTWDSVTANDDGSELGDLAGYRIYDGRESGNYDMVTDVGTDTRVTLYDLEPGTYYVAVAAYDHFGNEGPLSNEIVTELVAD